MAVRAEQFPLPFALVLRWLQASATTWSAALKATARLRDSVQRPSMGTMSAEWLREHAARARADESP
jgi:hypothetical protein